MNDIPADIIPAGTRLSFGGGLWQVAEIIATEAVMREALGGLWQVGISRLLADPAIRLLDAASAPPPVAGPSASGSPAGAWRGE
jgi:hypothetical protein